MLKYATDLTKDSAGIIAIYKCLLEAAGRILCIGFTFSMHCLSDDANCSLLH